VAVQQGGDLDGVRPLERLPVVVDEHPVGAPVVLGGLKRPPCLANLHARNVPRPAQKLHGEGEPVRAGPSVHLEGDVLVGVLARHPLVQDVVQPDVAQLRFLARIRHATDGRATEVEGRGARAAVVAARAQVRDDDPRGRGAAARVAAHHVVALPTPLPPLEDGRVPGRNLVTIRSTCQLSVPTRSPCSKNK
jgi:hypothetical protein